MKTTSIDLSREIGSSHINQSLTKIYMKPSSRIEEIWKEKYAYGDEHTKRQAIIDYLDERWEAEQCQHGPEGFCNKCVGSPSSTIL